MGEGGGGVFLKLILITWPQAVRQMRGVGRGEVGGGRGGDMKQITAHSNPYSSFSLSFCPLCIRRGLDKKFRTWPCRTEVQGCIGAKCAKWMQLLTGAE